ncbi:hypothetical protein MBLNU230_g6625t1 [Neophaeotheca triangularis]
MSSLYNAIVLHPLAQYALDRINKDDTDLHTAIHDPRVTKYANHAARHSQPMVLCDCRLSFLSLPSELRNRIYEHHLEDLISDRRAAMALIKTCRTVYTEFTPMFYAGIDVTFEVNDLYFEAVARFIRSLGNLAISGLKHNARLTIAMTFSADDVDTNDMMLLANWLSFCQQVRMSGKLGWTGRVPFQYLARSEDMFAHLDVESKVVQLRHLGPIREELDLMVREFHQCQVR